MLEVPQSICFLKKEIPKQHIWVQLFRLQKAISLSNHIKLLHCTHFKKKQLVLH